MLSSIRVKNFKSFGDTTQIDLAPLTFLAGINSAGKSSIIQALLLLKQTLESEPTLALNPGRGALLEQSLGDKFNDFIFGCPPLEEAALTYHLAFEYDAETIADSSVRDLFDEIDALLPYSTVNGVSRSLTVWMTVTFAWGPFGHRGRPTVRVADLQITTILGLDASQKPLIGVQIRPTGGGDYQIKLLLEDTDPSLQELNFQQVHLDGLANFLPGALLIDAAQPGLFERNVPPALARFFRSLLALIRQDLTENILYLGSFRKPPERFYSSGQSTANAVDPTGSNFAEVLWRFRDESVSFQYPKLPTDQLPLKAMTAWVLEEVLQLNQRVSVQSVGEREDILEVLVETSGLFPDPELLLSVELTSESNLDGNNFLPDLQQEFRRKNISLSESGLNVRPVGASRWLLEDPGHQQSYVVIKEGKKLKVYQNHIRRIPLSGVGLGYNQILPVVVQGLLTPPGSMVIYEQPEIHLHPDVQARLVQFFIGLARAGRQVLVETHSDHLVDYLCLGIAKDRSNWLHDNSQVYFVHPQDSQHASATIERVQIDLFGDIVNYPEGFLPDKAAFYEEKAQEALDKLSQEKHT